MSQSGTATTTVYVGNVEEVSTSGGTTTTTAYYYASGKRIGLSVNGTISYLASDGLGSATVTLSSSGSATAAQLFAPYGGVRYSSGTMPTMYGFTGQRSDAASGLDYYGSRYYDPLAGQFTSGDSVLPGGGFDVWGLSRYGYVGGNPIVRTDPTGHILVDEGSGGGPPDTPPADPCGGACYYDYNGTNGGTSYTPPPPDPVPSPVNGPTCGCTASAAPAANPTSPNTQAPTIQSFVPQLMGVGIGAQADAGRGPEAAGDTISLDLFGPIPYDGPSYDVVGFTTGGFARNDAALQIGPVTIPAFSAGYPPQDRGDVFGLYGGAGLHILLTNAHGPDDLRGPFTQYSLNLGYVDTLGVQLSVGTNGKGQPIYVASLAPRFLPLGAGIGIAGSRYTTYTKILWSALSGGLMEGAS